LVIALVSGQKAEPSIEGVQTRTPSFFSYAFNIHSEEKVDLTFRPAAQAWKGRILWLLWID
jgi:hypothetical protein